MAFSNAFEDVKVNKEKESKFDSCRKCFGLKNNNKNDRKIA